MKKILIILLFPLLLSSCIKSKDNNTAIISENITSEEINMKLIIDNKEIEVSWLNNASVKALNEIKPIEINMNRYSNFEQVGSIGRSIISNDTNITTNPGDIVLYNSSNIVVFYGSNNWDYTKLGHINLSNEELKELLDKSSIILKIE